MFQKNLNFVKLITNLFNEQKKKSTSELTSPCTLHTIFMSQPSLACTQDFSTVISGGAEKKM